ncbi:uncharacterized protein CDV56_107648 [Aspergillus thermomutatus]|uniref:Trichodiene synthase n=1 Tax=Aspergillus thermomutatus TaxID=41047 RepID=A0A397H0C4_ASPTH|nr:uncharacterized protein CDV56_107648 [Aspergillus thermomutatus]RHZ55174.1 hypothetical protein CDV56_107648 [Aspergillus thermomutatus]
MVTERFPADLFCRSIVRFLDAIDYHDDNLTRDERVQGLRHVHSKTAEYFAQPLPKAILRSVSPVRIAAVTRTISHFVVYCWSKVPRDVQVDISIYLSIINVLDDEINSDPSTQMASFWTDLIQGKRQTHPFWVLMNAHLPQLLTNYGSFCAFNIMRCTFDYFEGCWIEQHNFQGYPGSDCFPMFLRRLNCLGGAVAGTIFPACDFDDRKHLKEIACVMSQMDGPVALINDLFSFYKEFDQDEANLVSSWCVVDGITMDEALERLTDQTTNACVRILQLFKDRHPKILATLRGFIHGYVTWHFCDLRYRLRELYERGDTSEASARFRRYFDTALSVGWVEIEEWTCPVEGFEVEGPGPRNGTEVQAYQYNAFRLDGAVINGSETYATGLDCEAMGTAPKSIAGTEVAY